MGTVELLSTIETLPVAWMRSYTIINERQFLKDDALRTSALISAIEFALWLEVFDHAISCAIDRGVEAASRRRVLTF